MIGSTARADGVDVRPVTIETRDCVGLVVVANPGDRRIDLESQVLDWSQDASGQETLTETAVAMASPPAMWVPPHSSYTLRVRLPAGPSPSVERAYRLIVRQLPERSDISGGRIVFALTQNLPAFVLPPDPVPPALTARLQGANRLWVSNSGGRRVRITRVSQDGQTVGDGLLG